MRSIRIVACAFFVFMCIPIGKVSGADWKYIGASSIDDTKVLVFYDAETVKSLANGHIIAWTKGANQSSLKNVLEEAVNDKDESSIINKNVHKQLEGYIPPFCLLRSDFNYYTIVDIMSWEEAANNFKVATLTHILWEIDCQEKMIMSVSADMYDNRGELKGISREKSEFDYIAPGTNADTLMKILCKSN